MTTPASGGDQRVELLMRTISYALAVLIALVGFAMAMGVMIYGLSHQEAKTSLVASTIIGSTVTVSSLVAALGRVISWSQFRQVVPHPHAPAAGGHLAT